MVIAAYIVAGVIVAAILTLLTIAIVMYVKTGIDDECRWIQYRVRTATYDVLTARKLSKH